jgi:hypothetical protein
MLPALEIMHILGYVHRDVSAGNILFWNGNGLLSDLESVKKTSDLSTHEVRTVRLMSHYVCLPLHSPSHNKGTNQYESVEVREQGYIFMMDEGDESDESDGSGDSDEKDNKYDEYYGSPPPFKFNCLHDLESAWWIALCVLFHHVPLGDVEDHSAQTKHAAELFPSVGSSSSRANAFLGGIKRFRQHLPLAFWPSVENLSRAQGLLVRRYKRAEKGSSINEAAFVDIHKKLRDIWLKARKNSKAIDYRFVLQAKRGATDEASAILSKRPKFNPS